MNRRRFVAGVGAAVPWFAGCTRPRAETEARGTSYALEAHPIGDDGIRVAFATQAGGLSDEALSVFSATLDGNPRTYGYTVFDDGTLVEYGGRFYRVTVEETGRRTHERPILRGAVAESEAAERKAVELSAYPRADDHAVSQVAKKATSRGDPDDAAGRERDFYVLRNRDPEVSELLPEPKYEYVEYGDSVVRLSVERRRLTEMEFTYAATKVANSTTAFREFVREEVVGVWLDGTNLSGSQRTIFERATSGEYAESGDLSADYRALLERVFGSALPEETTGERIGYDGRLYKVVFHVSND
ncbi:hypothetical protein [Halorussus sp. MSC15.2]|uniref:hypothetical protein n=1 Tax=Halorussus sp. MSC15.2 TaxID=2283638 RepID=UPI0013D5DAD2|nr:hypothetical protein [Halorussus sp. MSC15.2]NEU55328.1 hypothetical protein [Halorussus sp. MSC15.2]